MVPVPQDRVFQEYDQKTFWGYIEEATDKKIVIKWDTVDAIGAIETTFHGDLSSIIKVRDCWQIKL